jgi:hypothetical protein
MTRNELTDLELKLKLPFIQELVLRRLRWQLTSLTLALLRSRVKTNTVDVLAHDGPLLEQTLAP